MSLGSVSASSNATIDKLAEPFRDKILRKCGESVEMKEKFFEKYAAEIEALSKDMAERFSQGHKLLTMGNGGSLVRRFALRGRIHASNHRKARCLFRDSVDDRHRDDDRRQQRHGFRARLSSINCVYSVNRATSHSP